MTLRQYAKGMGAGQLIDGMENGKLLELFTNLQAVVGQFKGSNVAADSDDNS